VKEYPTVKEALQDRKDIFEKVNDRMTQSQKEEKKIIKEENILK